MSTCVWAFRPLPELNNRTGFVECDEALAVALIATGDAQDPRHGANVLKVIEAAPPPRARRDDEYDTKILTAKRPRGKK